MSKPISFANLYREEQEPLVRVLETRPLHGLEPDAIGRYADGRLLLTKESADALCRFLRQRRYGIRAVEELADTLRETQGLDF